MRIKYATQAKILSQTLSRTDFGNTNMAINVVHMQYFGIRIVAK